MPRLHGRAVLARLLLLDDVADYGVVLHHFDAGHQVELLHATRCGREGEGGKEAPVWLYAYIHSYILTYILTYIQTNIHMHACTHMHTYTHTYTHTYLRT